MYQWTHLIFFVIFIIFPYIIIDDVFLVHKLQI